MVDFKLSFSSAEFAELSEDLLHLGKAMRFTAHGTSMQPLVRNGDVVLVKPAGARQIRVGDIVLCKKDPENILVHRVIRKQREANGDRFLVQGDQASQSDGWIKQEQVLGRLTAVERVDERIEFDSMKMKFLSFLAVIRSRSHSKDGKIASQIVALVKKIPIFNHYLE